MGRSGLAVLVCAIGLASAVSASAVDIPLDTPIALDIFSGLEWKSAAFPSISDSPIYTGNNWRSYACGAGDAACSAPLIATTWANFPNARPQDESFLAPNFARVGFDDSQWGKAVTVPNNVITPETIVPEGTSAKFMWSPQGMQGSPTGGNGLAEAFFRFSFQVPATTGQSLSAIATIIADDRFDFYVNGKLTEPVAAGTLEFHMDPTDPTRKRPDPISIDFTNNLRVGPVDQVIAIRARDGFPVSSSSVCPYPDTCDLFDIQHRVNQFVFFQGRVETPEPGTILVLGSGLLGLVGWRRKQVKSARAAGF